MEGIEVSQNREPVVMTMAEYVKSPPKGKWVKLSKCQVILEECVYEYTEGKEEDIDTVYVPIVPEGAELPTPLVVEDKSYIPLIQKTLKMSDTELEEYLTKNEGILREVKSYEGWVDTPGSIARSNFGGKVVKPDFKVLEHGNIKGWGDALLLIGIGVGALLLGTFLFKTRE